MKDFIIGEKLPSARSSFDEKYISEMLYSRKIFLTILESDSDTHPDTVTTLVTDTAF
jgi:hypothetical protein